MANRTFNPPTMAAPAGTYSHGVESPPGARWLHVAGQVGINPDGSCSPDIAKQVDRVFLNLAEVLAGASMGFADVVKMTVFLTRAGDIPAYREVRNRHLGDNRPASTLLVVSALASPSFLVEVELIAAKAP